MKYLKGIFIVLISFIIGFYFMLGVNYLFALAGSPQSVWLMETLGIM